MGADQTALSVKAEEEEDALHSRTLVRCSNRALQMKLNLHILLQDYD
jgi:hypothetical protein